MAGGCVILTFLMKHLLIFIEDERTGCLLELDGLHGYPISLIMIK